MCIMIYPDNFETRIGFDTVRAEVARRCMSPLGASHCVAMHFSSRLDEVTTWLQQTHEFVAIETSHQDFPLNHYIDVRGLLKSISAPGTYLSAEGLFNVQRSLTTIGEIGSFFRMADHAATYPALARLTHDMEAFPHIVSEIAAILDKFGNIKDNASPELAELRRSLQGTLASINGIMRRVIAQGKAAGTLDADVQPSMRDGRLVLPVAPMNKRKVKGIVHDESASGKTVFIEPEEIVEANNRIREIEGEIAREIIRILTVVTDTIRPHVDAMLASYDTLGVIDFVRAKALFALDVGGQLPHIDGNKPHIEWYHAVHPTLLLTLREQGKEVVPLNITLTQEQRILLISGPNAGGKSVCLKTVGVVQYMMQCGLLPTLHDNSHMGLVASIGIDIGDQQSIEDDLSTYSSHLQNMKRFLALGDRNTLILIDEFGSGTEPQIGGAIAQAILEKLNEKGVFGVITTHYQNLKHFADETPGIVNGAMLYDRQRMEPLFQLSMGYPGSSFAIEIARKIGLPVAVIDKAAEIVGSDYVNMDKYLLDIVRDRRYWEHKRSDIRSKEKRLDAIVADYEARLERIAAEHRTIIHEAREEARTIVAQSNAQVERTIREIREMQAEKEKTREVRRQLDEFKQRLEQDAPIQESEHISSLKPKRKLRTRKQAEPAPQPDATRPLQQGDRVTLKGSSTVGTIMSIDEKYAIVAFGNIKTRVETSKLERTNRKAERAMQQQQTMSNASAADIRQRQLNFKPDIDVRGMRADEAIQAVTYFIDDAIQFSSQRVRILHGTGTGVLREVIRQYLATVPGVKAYHDEHVQFGGAGITVVDLD